MAVISLVFSGTLRQDEAGVGRVGAQRMLRFEALAPVVGVRREVLPWMAIRSCRAGDIARIQSSKQRAKARFTKMRSPRSQGSPQWNGANLHRKSR
jgi:hypothetical protein